MDRRDAVQLIVTAPLAAAFRWTPESVREASALAREALSRGVPYEPKNFTAHEWETVRLLVHARRRPRPADSRARRARLA